MDIETTTSLYKSCDISPPDDNIIDVSSSAGAVQVSGSFPGISQPQTPSLAATQTPMQTQSQSDPSHSCNTRAELRAGNS